MAFVAVGAAHAGADAAAGVLQVSRAFSVAALVVGLVGLALFGSIYFITLYFQNIQGYSALEAGVRTLPTTLMVLLVAPVAGRLNTRIGSGPMMVIGMLRPRSPCSGWRRWTSDTSYNADLAVLRAARRGPRA